MKTLRNNKEKGAVSIFVVIFAMLLITVITVSFLRLMMIDQRQASDNDLSQSAYDSAQAGIEDAKRALLRYQQICTSSPSSCSSLSDQFVQAYDTKNCNAALRFGDVVKLGDVNGGTATQPGEVFVQQSTNGSDKALNQAYTCVLVQLETDDYVWPIKSGESQLVPLVGKTDYDTVTVRWYDKDNQTSTDGSVTLPGISGTHPFVAQSAWSANTPAVMKAQLVQFGTSFKLSSFDFVSGGDSNTNSVYLYPTSGVGATAADFTALDTRANSATDEPDADNATDTAHPINCLSNISSGGYACSMSLKLPNPINGGSRTAFLRLTPFYNAANVQVVLSNGVPNATGNNIVKFKNVEPIIDSTGRANDVFRRVESRVNLYNTDFPYPDATIDITNNFCKTFAVSDVPATYDSTNTCTQ